MHKMLSREGQCNGDKLIAQTLKDNPCQVRQYS